MGVVLGTSFLAGAVLGLRFKVLVLLPAMFVTAVVVGIAAINSLSGLWSLALMVIVATTAIQLGYLVGAMASLFLGQGINQHEDASGMREAAQRLLGSGG